MTEKSLQNHKLHTPRSKMPTALADAIAATNRNKNNRAETDGIKTSVERSTVQLKSKTSFSILVVSNLTRMRCVNGEIIVR